MKRRKYQGLSLPVIGTVALLGATVAVSSVMADRKFEPLAEPLGTISRDIAGYHSAPSGDATLTAGVLEQLRPTSYLIRRYTKAAVSMDVFIAFYGQQRAGESMHSPKHCFPGAGWEIWDTSRTMLPMKGQTVEVNRYTIGREGEQLLMMYWYQSKNRIIASEYEGKLLLARDALLHNSTAASIVRITAPVQPGAGDDAVRFATELLPEVQRCFRGKQ